MKVYLYFTVLLLVSIPHITIAQQFQMALLPSEAFEKYARTPSTTESSLEDFKANTFEITRTEIRSGDLPSPYGLDQWVGGQVTSTLESPTAFRMFVDERPLYVVCNSARCGGGSTPRIVSLMALKPYVVNEASRPVSHNQTKGNRYDNKPAPGFVIIDLAESEHLGMVPGSWRP